GAVPGRDVVEHAGGGEVGDEDTGSGGAGVPPAAGAQERFGREGEGVLLADVPAALVDDGEAVGVGVLGEADVGVGRYDRLTKLREVLPSRLWRMWEDPCPLCVVAYHLTPEVSLQ